jgi:S1-C subfamily serine protease
MRRLLGLALAVSLTSSSWCQTTKPLSNSDVIEMHIMGLGDDVLMDKIKASPGSQFDTSVESLKVLKQSGISDAVIRVMIVPQSATTSRVVDDLAVKFSLLKNGVFTVWTELGHGTGFLIAPDGLVLTNQHVIGPSEYIALQFDEKTKVPAILLAADAQRDVAVLWVDMSNLPNAVALELAKPSSINPPLVEGERVFTIGSPLSQQKVITSGITSKIEKTAIISDVNINHGNSGGPLFNSQGQVVGITTFGDFTKAGGPGISGILKIEETEAVLTDARKKMAASPKPGKDLLPVDPVDVFPIEALKSTISSEKFDTKPYLFQEGDFEVAIITPPFKYFEGAESELRALNEKSKRNRKSSVAIKDSFKPLDDLKDWEQYVGQFKPVIMIRAAPKFRETNLSALARGVAAGNGSYYAGAAVMKYKTDFYRMVLVCGDKEVAPISPGKIAHIVNIHSAFVHATDATYEGFYVFPSDAIGPACGKVMLNLYSEKKPQSAVSKELSDKTVAKIWADFEPYRVSLPGKSAEVK